MSLNSLYSVLLVILVVYCALALYIFLMQPKLLYYPNLPSRAVQATPADTGLEFDTVRLKTEDGPSLHGWYIPRQGARGTLLFCHGNAGNISHRLDSIRLFHDLGLNILIFDYRGYGESEGKPSEEGTYRDADAAWRYLTGERNIQSQDIVIFGRSLGAAVAANLAARTTPAAVIIESAFTSVPDMAAAIYPWLPVRMLAMYRYDTSEKLEEITQPVLIIHSRDDEIIPFSHGKRLYEHAHEPKQFMELHGGHNDGFLTSHDDYIRGLDVFITRYLQTAAD